MGKPMEPGDEFLVGDRHPVTQMQVHAAILAHPDEPEMKGAPIVIVDLVDLDGESRTYLFQQDAAEALMVGVTEALRALSNLADQNLT